MICPVVMHCFAPQIFIVISARSALLLAFGGGSSTVPFTPIPVNNYVKKQVKFGLFPFLPVFPRSPIFHPLS